MLTGFQIVDSTRRMIFLEGPKETMALLASKVPRGRANSEGHQTHASVVVIGASSSVSL